MNVSVGSARNDMLENQQTPRPEWSQLWNYISTQSPQDLEHLSDGIKHDLNKQAITYTIHGEANLEQAWDLDPLPYILAHAEWSSLVEALEQRARCLNALIADCYGPQNCISSGLIPADYVFEHPDFLQDCRSSKPKDNVYLHCYAADVMRTVDGTWQVLADRCQSPLGLGYALQNRFVVANALPDLYQKMEVQRHRSFFKMLDQCLRQSSNAANPNIAILASNTFGDNDYEQAFLARYLGYDLVTGQDLTIRDDRCYLKTVSGLRQIDVILRFVNDSWCDPLSFRSNSTLGVPGLLRAAVAGHVSIANALGSGLVDSPVLRPLVAHVCKQLLGEDPLIEGRESIRGADIPAALAQGPLVIKETWNALRSDPIFTESLNPQQLQQLKDKIAAHPTAWCADTMLTPSEAPVLDGAAIGYRPISLRMYLVRDGATYKALPGGLLRSASSANQLHFGARHGGGSKDCWVVNGQQETAQHTLPVMPPVAVNRLGMDLPSSQCDDLFWFGRHIERAEECARYLLIAHQMQREWDIGEREQLPAALVHVLRTLGVTLPAKMSHKVESLLLKALEPKQAVAEVISQLVQLSTKTQSYLSPDTWRQVQRLRDLNDHYHGDDPFDQMLLICSALSGTIAENMLHEDPWRFLELGKRLQRAVGAGRLLAAVASGGGKLEDLDLALSIADSQLTYRARYRSAVEFGPCIDLIAYDSANPRALSFQIDVIGQLIGQLPRPIADSDIVQVAYDDLHKRLYSASKCKTGDPGLKAELLTVVEAVHTLAESIDHLWFSHALPVISFGRNQTPSEYQR